jgi:hypothetical protein
VSQCQLLSKFDDRSARQFPLPLRLTFSSVHAGVAVGRSPGLPLLHIQEGSCLNLGPDRLTSLTYFVVFPSPSQANAIFSTVSVILSDSLCTDKSNSFIYLRTPAAVSAWKNVPSQVWRA